MGGSPGRHSEVRSGTTSALRGADRGTGAGYNTAMIKNANEPIKNVSLDKSYASSQGVDAHADALRDGLLAAGATEASFLVDLRARRVRDELAALTIKSDEDIDFSDIPATADSDWDGAERGKFYRPR